jgi:hypothetical protein
VAAAMVFAAWWLRISVPLQFAQFDRASLSVVDTGANPLLHWLSHAFASTKAARNVLGAIGVLVALMAAWRLGSTDLIGLLGVIGVVSRIFTYHSAYDDVLVAFLLIALSARAFGREGTMWWKAGWLLCGLTLWLPYTMYVPVTARGDRLLDAAWAPFLCILIAGTLAICRAEAWDHAQRPKTLVTRILRRADTSTSDCGRRGC